MINIKFKELMNIANKIPEGKHKVMHDLILATQLLYVNFYNRGYFINVQYGSQYMNPPALFIKKYCDDPEINNIIDELWGKYDIELYKEKLDKLTELIAKYIINNNRKKILNNYNKDSIYYISEFKVNLNEKIKYVRALKVIDANDGKYLCIHISSEDFRNNIWNKFNPKYINNYTIEFNYEEEPIHSFSVMKLKRKKDFKMQIQLLHFNAEKNEITIRLLLTILNNYEDQYMYEFDETFLGEDFIKKYILKNE